MTEYEKYLDSLSDEEFFRPAKNEKIGMEDTPYIKTEVGRTPSGGALSRAFYYDKDRKPCVPEEAVFVNIVEYDKDCNRINEVYGKMGL